MESRKEIYRTWNSSSPESSKLNSARSELFHSKSHSLLRFMSAMQSKTRDLQSEERSIETADFNSRFKNNEDRTIENENPNLISFSQKDIFLNFKVDAPSIHDSFKEIDDFIIRSKSGKLEWAQQKLQLATSQKGRLVN